MITLRRAASFGRNAVICSRSLIQIEPLIGLTDNRSSRIGVGQASEACHCVEGLPLVFHRTHSTCTLKSDNEWVQPTGYDTGISVYHPALKKKVPLVLQEKKMAKWYMCGPTVYDSAHIGHASSYVRFDIIRRILGSMFDVDSMLVMSITDIDDKIINRAKETGASVSQLTRAYEVEFVQDMIALNVSGPHAFVRVSDHMDDIMAFIQTIIHNGFGYVTDDGSVYFDVLKYGQYGQLHSISYDLEKKSDLYKRNPPDFALWKAAKSDEPSWRSPWGLGRPGWHIECSAMASKVFGSQLDIHCGGIDLLFPHHENEIAQSHSHFGCTQWCNYWMHTGHLFLKDASSKMSKSLKNTVSVRDLLESYTPNQFRMLCLLTHYRNSVEYSDEMMEKAVVVMTQLNSLVTQSDAYIQGRFDCPDILEAELLAKIHEARDTAEKAFADDFNTPRAMQAVTGLMKYLNQRLTNKCETPCPRSPAAVGAANIYIRRVLKQLGLDLGRKKTEEDTEAQQQFHFAMNTMTDFRSRVRNHCLDSQAFAEALNKHGASSLPPDTVKKVRGEVMAPLLAACDDVREHLASANIQIKDMKKQSTWNIEDRKRGSLLAEQKAQSA